MEWGGLASQIDAWAAARRPLSLRLESDALQGGLARRVRLQPPSLPLQSNPNRKGFSALRHRKEVTTGEERKEVRSEGADKNGVGAGNGPPSLPGVNCG